MAGGTLRDFIVILLAVAVIALCVIILSTVIRAAFHKRSMIVDASTEHLINPPDAYSRDGRPIDNRNGKPAPGNGDFNASGRDMPDAGGLFVPPDICQDMK